MLIIKNVHLISVQSWTYLVVSLYSFLYNLFGAVVGEYYQLKVIKCNKNVLYFILEILLTPDSCDLSWIFVDSPGRLWTIDAC